MKNMLRYLIISFVVLVSCDSHDDSTYFDNFIGTWVPIAYKFNTPIILKMQIEKRNAFYLIAAKYSNGDDLRFLIGKPLKDHILVTVSPEERSRENEMLVTNPPEIYFDNELKCILFLNTVYEFSHDRLFEISGLPVDGKKRLKIN